MTTEPLSSFNPRAFLAQVGSGSTVARFTPGQPAYLQGDPANAIFYIHSGRVKISVVSDLGKEAVVALLNEREFFGEGAMAGQSRRSATAVCLTESMIYRVEKPTFLRLMKAEPAFADVFVAHLLIRSVRIEADLADQLFNTSERRLARLLILLANHGSDNGPGRIIDDISQEMLAQMVGTTRARVSYFMNKFRTLGFISYNGRIEVHGELLSTVLQDQPPAEHRATESTPVINFAQPTPRSIS